MSPQRDVLSTVAVQDSDRPSGSLACPACAGIAEVGDPKSGWPSVELPPIPPAPGGQPVPSHRASLASGGSSRFPRRGFPACQSPAGRWPSGATRALLSRVPDEWAGHDPVPLLRSEADHG